MFGIGAKEIFIIFFIFVIYILPIILPVWKIFSKAGFSGWLSLLMFIPILNLVILFYVAFSEWPALKE